MQFVRIKNLREDADLTQKQMGFKLNISQRTYAHYENGTRDIPLEILIGIADIFEVSTDYLLNRTSNKKLFL